MNRNQKAILIKERIIAMSNQLDLRNVKQKNIYALGEDFRGSNQEGTEISFTNYYMEKDGAPFYAVSGEFHYSRMSDARWEDELIKMKMGGINVVTTYVFWNHHEEEEGVFDFTGCRNLHKFIELCKKHGFYVIMRVGPFDHGEVRNGGIPDWLYGKPFETRKLSEGFLACTKRLYTEIGKQVAGMFYQDGGPIIGVQIDNEYMHSSAAWEITTGISNEWVFGGDEGETYMLTMKQLAKDCGLVPVFFTCTAWGGAITPDSMMPLWGGYAFRPWMFYTERGEHPATEEYVYQDFHNNEVTTDYDFKPRYQPEEKPYACCEMGGGMSVSYYYRFQFQYKSVDAMANIKLASGCNFLGYYMFQGGSNPIGKWGTYMNEAQVPKISYDYQAALGEYGQVRESYRRLKSIHYFTSSFGEQLCALPTVMPEGASRIAPTDMDSLRYSVRSDGMRGFLFINNYQDHAKMPDRCREEIVLTLEKEEITFNFDIAADENAILPFHFQMDGIELIQATAQLITRIQPDGEVTYVFFTPEGMKGEFVFEDGVTINGLEESRYQSPEQDAHSFLVKKDGRSIRILVLSRKMADAMYMISEDRLVFTKGVVLEAEGKLRLETTEAENRVYTYPAGIWQDGRCVTKYDTGKDAVLGEYAVEIQEKKVEAVVTEVARGRYTVSLPEDFMDGLKDARLQISYQGDIGHAFLNGRMINDNFANGAVWEIGLSDFAKELKDDSIVLYIAPLREGVKVNVESPMAARREEVEMSVAVLHDVHVQPVYDIEITL
jgi:hypothetical protein